MITRCLSPNSLPWPLVYPVILAKRLCDGAVSAALLGSLAAAGSGPASKKSRNIAAASSGRYFILTSMANYGLGAVGPGTIASDDAVLEADVVVELEGSGPGAGGSSSLKSSPGSIPPTILPVATSSIRNRTPLLAA